jgi:hypothetical protein
MAEEQKQEEGKEEAKPEQKQETLVDVLFRQPTAPTQDEIERWKMKHGDVYVSVLSESEVFIFRAITRPEWIKLQQIMADPEAKMDQFKFEEMICNQCVLWKSIAVSWDMGKGGTPMTLHEQVLQNSNFMSPQAASIFVAKL